MKYPTIKRWTPIVALAIGISLLSALARAEIVADFDDLTLDTDSYWNGSDLSGSFTSGNATFLNGFTDFGGGFTSWDGWAYSNMTDTTTPGFDSQYSAFPGGGQGGSPNYGVAYQSAPSSVGPPTLLPADGQTATISGAWLTNTTYSALSMLQGDQFAKKFGGQPGDDPDWFLVSIKGYDAAGAESGTVEFYLADYRFEDNSQDYIVDQWTWVDFSSLGELSALEFRLSSSDNDPLWGMNTPAYFAMDSVGIVPEPSTFVLIVSGVLCCLFWWRRCSLPKG